MRRAAAVLLGVVMSGTGCYHATVETGATPSAETVEKAWASGWILGLVPPSAVSSAQKCTSGVAQVETQLSFVNMLVGVLTFGIYTPMNIKVTCAARRTAGTDQAPAVRVGEDEPSLEEAIERAAEMSKREGVAIDVVW